MVLLTIQLFISFLLRWINLRLNVKKKARLEEEKVRRGWTDGDVQKERERHAFLDLTDKQYVTSHTTLHPFPIVIPTHTSTPLVQEYVLRVHSVMYAIREVVTACWSVVRLSRPCS